jgi:hypothetical protein
MSVTRQRRKKESIRQQSRTDLQRCTALFNDFRQSFQVSGQWSVDGGRWTVDGGRWTVDGGRWTVWRPSDYNLRPVFCTPGNRHRSSSCGQAHTQTVCRVTAVRSTGFSRNRTPTEPTSATDEHRFSRIDARGGAGGRGESTPCLLPLGGFAGCLVSREDAKEAAKSSC